MNCSKIRSDADADIFVKLIERGSRQSFSESVSGKLQSIVFLNPKVITPLVAELEACRSDPYYVEMINRLALSNFSQILDSFAPIDKFIAETSTGFSRSIFHLDQARGVGQESDWLVAALAAMKNVQSQTDLYLVMMRFVFCLNKMGQYKRSQDCSMIAYVVSQNLEDEAFTQRSEFAMLHSTRLTGGADVSPEYFFLCEQMVSGKLKYASTNQCLLPTYAAMHLMDLGQDSKALRELLDLSTECVLEDFSSTNSKIAKARYNLLTGRKLKAKSQVSELVESIRLSVIDVPVLRQLLALAKELSVSTAEFEYPAAIPASRTQWHKFDLEIDSLWRKFKPNLRAQL